ncbi:MAG: hypothetical protein ACQ9MH_10745 [Nitrospinales bacterium]
MSLPDIFNKATEKNVQETLSSGKSVLIVTTLASPAYKDLCKILHAPNVSDSLEKFQCFYIPFGADICETYSLFKPAALFVLENRERPSSQLVNNGRGVLFASDVIKFLEDNIA